MKVWIVFEIYETIDEDGNNEEFRLFHKVFASPDAAKSHVSGLGAIPENEGIEFEVEEVEVEQ